MRMVSQCGMMDFPYGAFCLAIEEFSSVHYCINAHCANNPTNSGIVLANYSTKEKAENAMSYLHDLYNEYIYDKYGNNSVDGVFKFPSDDEV